MWIALVLFLALIFIIISGHEKMDEKIKVSKVIAGEKIVIGVVADTHVPDRAKRIPAKVFEIFEQREVDLIIHAGDLVTLDVLSDLEKIAPVIAVHGNMDGYDVRAKLPRIGGVQVNDFKIGIIHDTLNPFSDKMHKLAIENGLDVMIFGHTHRPWLKRDEGIWFMNPGSPTCPFFAKASVGIIEVSDDIKAEIVYI